MNQRMESVERWANFIKSNPDKWKKIHTEFIDAQFEKCYGFLRRLSKQKNGAEKIMKLYNIKNLKGYPKLLNKK